MTGTDALRERMRLAKDALVRTGYFTADEVGDDIAPRIIELWSALARLTAARLDVERLAQAMEDFFGHDEWYFDSPETDFIRYAREVEARYRTDGAEGHGRPND